MVLDRGFWGFCWVFWGLGFFLGVVVVVLNGGGGWGVLCVCLYVCVFYGVYHHHHRRRHHHHLYASSEIELNVRRYPLTVWGWGCSF